MRTESRAGLDVAQTTRRNRAVVNVMTLGAGAAPVTFSRTYEAKVLRGMG